ncbi:MAG TPA: hypothetical protein VEJ42_04330 [Streptosporangiaceae bacterium]|nr:hypothetical protein [Streptosporangiaceae bacterium]
MTDLCRPSAGPRRCHGMIAAAGVVAALLAGCGGAAPAARLPARPALPPVTTRATTGTAAVASARQQVIAALAGYTAALSQADKSRSAVQARHLLQPYLVASRIAGVVQTMSSIWARGEVFFGQDLLHVQSVIVTGQSAFVRDCDNTSGMGLAYQSTGQLVPGSAGVSELNVVTHLELTGGRWLVQFQLIEDVPCTS